MDKAIKDRIDAIRQGCIPKGYNRSRYMLYPEDWGEPCALNAVLRENKELNGNLEYDKDDVLSVSGDYGVVNQIDLLGRSYAGESVAPYHIVHTGDIVYTKSPLKQNPHGIIKLNKGNSGIVSTLYAVYYCNNNITGQYIENYFSIDSYLNNYLKPIVKRGAKNDMKVNNEDVLTGFIPLPPLSEQKKISEILDHYDKLIKLCETKIDEYKNLKKACLSKMFPRNGSNVPELRFLGFAGAWEQRELGDHSEIITGGTPNTSHSEYWNPKEIPWMSSGEINSKVIYTTDNMISKTGFSNSSAKWVKEKSVLIALAGQGKTRGTVAITEISLTTNQSIAAIQPDKLLYYKYLFQNLEGRYDELRNISSGDGTRGGLNKKIISDLTVLAPDINEQRKIGDFLCALDRLITLHQREVEEYTRFKKAMTQLLLTGIVRVHI